MSAQDDLVPRKGRSARFLWLASLAAGLAAISSIGLLGVSGWFLTGAALAGAAGLAAVTAFNYLIPSALIRLLAITRTVTRYGERIWSHQAALEHMAGLRAGIFARLAAQDGRKVADFAPGDASARLIGDIGALEDLIIRGPARAGALAAAATSVALALLAGWRPALLLGVMLALLPFLLRHLSARLTRGPAEVAAEKLGTLRARYVELAAARAEIVAYGLAEPMIAGLAPEIAAYDRARRTLFVAEAIQAGMLIVYGGIVVVGILFLSQASAPFVALAMLSAAAGVEGMAAISRTAIRRSAVEAGLSRLVELRGLEGEPEKAATIPIAAEPIRLGCEALSPGSRVAVIGPSGSGKTRLLETLCGLRGDDLPLFVGARPVQVCPARELTAQFALVAQDAPMLAGTVADNLRLARPGIHEDEMRQALRIAQLADRITAAPAGLETRLGEAGGYFSGGERKRLALARALLARRPWLLLDEPTEGLDAATEAALVTALDAWLRETGTGLVLVSHRPAPLALAERRIAVESLA